jgi:hypothetical protein
MPVLFKKGRGIIDDIVYLGYSIHRFKTYTQTMDRQSKLRFEIIRISFLPVCCGTFRDPHLGPSIDPGFAG